MPPLRVLRIVHFGHATDYDMPLKLILLFLIVMAVVAMFGRLRFPRAAAKPKTCSKCGRHLIGKGDCTCRKGA